MRNKRKNVTQPQAIQRAPDLGGHIAFMEKAIKNYMGNPDWGECNKR